MGNYGSATRAPHLTSDNRRISPIFQYTLALAQRVQKLDSMNKLLIALALVVATVGPAYAEQHTTIHHGDGTRTEVRTRGHDTYVDHHRANGERRGGASHGDSHKETVERHTDHGDKVVKH